MDEELILSSRNKSLNLSYDTVMKTFVRPDKSHLLIFSLRQNYFFFWLHERRGCVLPIKSVSNNTFLD